jgi:cyclophilin family peptidyl-prolyl cis-trans isomerase
MRATEGFANPFQAFGALGMIHDPEDNDTASSQFFFLKWDQGLVAPGRNTLDGSSASFGYVVKNENALKQVKKGDVIAKATVVEGGSRLQK